MSNNSNMTSGYDASLPLTVDDVDMFYTLNKTLKDNIKQNFKMLMLTAPGERIMVPDYGVGFRNFLFETFPDANIRNRIYDQVNNFLPQVEIIQLEINRGDVLTAKKTGDKNTLVVSIFYEIKGTNLRDTVTLTGELLN